MDFFKFFKCGANTQRTINLGIKHRLSYLWKFSLELGKAKVAVGICEHAKSVKSGLIKNQIWPQAIKYRRK